MGIRKLQPRSLLWRITALVILVPFLCCLLLYLGLLGAEYHSARQASQILEKLEAMRVGDPAVTFERAAEGCSYARMHAEYSCDLVAGAFQFRPLWTLFSRLPPQRSYDFSRFLDHLGLRFWRLYATASAREGLIQEVSAQLTVVGKYEMLGAHWELGQSVPAYHLQPDSGVAEHRTTIHWFHITSVPSGEGIQLDETPDSTETELRARRINRRCLFTIEGCDGLCDILPDVAPVFKERNLQWGGSKSALASHCSLN